MNRGNQSLGFLSLKDALKALHFRVKTITIAGFVARSPWLVGGSLALTTLLLWWALSSREQAQIQQMVAIRTNDVKNDISTQTETRILALGRMASRWSLRAEPSRTEWESDATFYLQDYASFRTIAWVDPSAHIRWIVPSNTNHVALDSNLSQGTQPWLRPEVARDRFHVTILPTTEIQATASKGDKVFFVYIPILKDQEIGGFIRSEFQVQKFFDAILAKDIEPGYGIAIFENQTKIYSSIQSDPSLEQQWAQTATIKLYGTSWQVRVWPTPKLLARAQSPLPDVILVSGLLMAILSTAMVYLAQAAHLRFREAEVANQELALEIVGRRQAEAQLKTSLGEKELLLKEIHHRVKNNLQVIYSLLRMQSRLVKDRSILEMLKESQNRVKSMALIHEKLYKSQDLAKIDFAEYTRSLAANLLSSYGTSADKISLEVKIEDVILDINTAIPCGLIINELISNSLKHAFPNNRQGQIQIQLYATHSGQYVLIARDNGIGLPENFDLAQTKTLGLKLVKTLVSQLEGTLAISSDTTEFKITFGEARSDATA
ncbi:histidine kinase dimerization/phosphoacceptor domain -containing protein [Leptolyngbya sp. FACHB-261]|uniref:histidine kinase dimerization/phosphoacceptor domain -containing protein n=1 Tax=Leptolyngbya sp. FACHB-261 TaxID=2692806 RepID=UPI0016841357|nr:histidine kinase dimerization/phosphoacceptor domain -containing protein [Leptolyngbya sp. FACHB-261]MBD2102061.1 hypothetical protein [Leptolyngbya sp. FACHB-261]